MPLRHLCWLLLAVIAGTSTGFKIGLPGSGAAVSASPSSIQQEAASGMAFAPATGRPPGKAVGLYTVREAPVGLQKGAGVDGESLAVTAEPMGDDGVAQPAPYARDLTFLAFPTGATVATPAATARTPTSTPAP